MKKLNRRKKKGVKTQKWSRPYPLKGSPETKVAKRTSGTLELQTRKGEVHRKLEEESDFIFEKAATGQPFPIVGVGASAGGFEAFSELLKFVPADTGMAFVLVQHLDPKHKSQLSELLGRAVTLPITEARDGIAVEPNQVYVIPANARITLVDGHLEVAPRKENELPPMPIDAFFRSLAAEQ